MSEILNYVDLIDQMYAEARNSGLSRFSVEWGKWSAEMNREIRGKIESGTHPKEAALKYVFIYWVNRSQLLEAHHKTRWFQKRTLKKNLSEEGDKIRGFIFDENAPNPKSFDPKSIVLASISEYRA